jgi:hypothetical protein
MKPRNRPAWTLVPPNDRTRKGTVGNNRKAERNVVKVNEQSRKNRGLKRAGRCEALSVAVVEMSPPKFQQLAVNSRPKLVCLLTANR